MSSHSQDDGPASESREQAFRQTPEDLDGREETAALVDDIEADLEAERVSQGVPGNRADREKMDPVDTGDDAPD
jgi:hypothetical protein